MNIDTFLKQYGIKGLGLTVSEFIARSPDFEGDKKLASLIGEMIADLESAFQDWLNYDKGLIYGPNYKSKLD